MTHFFDIKYYFPRKKKRKRHEARHLQTQNSRATSYISNLWTLFLICNIILNIMISTNSITQAEFSFHLGTFSEIKEMTVVSSYRQDLCNGYSLGQLLKMELFYYLIYIIK